MYLYPRLKNLREDHDLTQAEVAKILCTTQQQYSKYEMGIQEIPVHHLISLARYYHIKIDYILGEEDDKR